MYKKLDRKFYEDSYYNRIKLFIELTSYLYQPIVDRVRTIRNNLIQIKDIEI